MNPSQSLQRFMHYRLRLVAYLSGKDDQSGCALHLLDLSIIFGFHAGTDRGWSHIYAVSRRLKLYHRPTSNELDQLV